MKRFLAVLICLFLGALVWGLNLEPLSISFEPSGRNSIRTFRVSNNQNQSIAVRITMTTRELQLDGTEIRNPADSEFTVFPQSIFLAPGQTQAVRVQWRGDANITGEKAYRIIAEQLPVQDGSPGAAEAGVSLNFLFRYVGSVYITPGNTKEKIEFKEINPAKTDSGQTDPALLELVFENTGTGHGIITNAEITLRAGNSDGIPIEYNVDYKDLKVLSGINFLAGAKLSEVIVIPDNLQGRIIEVDYRFETTK